MLPQQSPSGRPDFCADGRIYITIIPDEENKKLIITQAVAGAEGEKYFLCYKCDNLTGVDNAKNINMKEKNQCNRTIKAGLLFANIEISDIDSTKNHSQKKARS